MDILWRYILEIHLIDLCADFHIVRHLREALAARKAGLDLDAVGVCVQDALTALYSLTGENAADAVVDEVFSRFCVGK